MTAPLLGRERELEAFAEALAEAERGFLVAVAGEPGIGKTRLLDELAGMVTTVGGTVLTGRATERSPYMLADVLHDHGLAGLKTAATAPGPVCLLLDDVHLAGRDSWRPIRKPPAGLLVAVAYRSRQAPPELERLVGQAVVDGKGTLLEPRPLSPAEVATLADGRPEPGLYRRSGGIPFYVHAMLGMPDAELQGAFEREFAALTDVERLVLHASAVAGERFDTGLVATIAGLETAETRTALRRLAARDLVRGAPDRHRHPLLRTAAYATAPPGWRLAAHGRAAAELTVRGAPALVRAPHLELAAEPGDGAAVDVLTVAAREAAGNAPGEAAHLLGVALTLLPDRPESAHRRTELTVLRARLLITSGRFEAGRTLLHEALPGLPPGSGGTRTEAVLACAAVERMLGRHAEAQARLAAELDVLVEPGGRIEAQLELVAGWVLGGQQDEDPGWPDELIPAARRRGDEALLASVLAVGALSSLYRGESKPEWLDEAAALVEAVPDERAVEASLWVGMACAGADRLAAADRHLTRALRLARASGRRHLSVYVRCALGWVWCLLGRLGEADRCLSVAVDAARFTGSDELLVMTMAQRSWVLSWRRQEELARRLASEAATTAGMAGLRGGRVSVLAGAVLARAMADAGDRDGCAQLLRAAGGGSDLPEFDAVSRVTWLALLAEVEAERGDLMRAVAAAGVAEEVAGRLDLPGLTALAHQARACTVEPVQAARRQVSAAELFAGSGWRLHEGRARLRAAAALAVTGDDAGATEQLDLAEALLSRGEGRAHLDDVHRQRRRIGAQGPAGAALALLSEREREIVRMVAAGQTNREIAEVLFLSARTVEAHLTRIFGKLGVTSRVSLAALYAT